MATSTYALPVKTARATLPGTKKHERRKSSMQSPTMTARSPAGSVSHKLHAPGTAHSEDGLQHARKISSSNSSNNVLGIEGVKSWESRGSVAVGPVPVAVKGRRHRGQSEMGRRFPLQTTFLTSPRSPRTPLSAKPNTSFDEIFNGILLPLPFLAASLAFPSDHSPFAGPPRAPAEAHVEDTAEMMEEIHRHQHFVQAGALSAAALLLMGTIARLRLSDTVLDRRKSVSGNTVKESARRRSRLGFSTVKSFVSRTLSIALPFYAAVQLGGVRVAFVLLFTIAAGLSNTGMNGKASLLNRLYARQEAVLLLIALVVVDSTGLLGNYALLDLALGYTALLTSALAIPPPIPYLDRLLGRSMPILTSAPPTPAGPTPPVTPWPSGSSRKDTSPSKIADANTSIAAGATLAVLTTALSYHLAIPLQLSPIHFAFSMLAMITISGLTFFALPVTIGSRGKPGLAAGLLITSLFAFAQSQQIFGATTAIPFVFAMFSVAGYFVALRSSAPDFGHFKESTVRKGKDGQSYSMFTGYLLSYCAPGSMLDTILSEKDSRRIAYFACLNLAFMLVQFFYGFVTGSLGLLTDSIHMLFDCLGLAVGLAAAVMSKWPPSLAFPYGYGKVDTLSGFANGIFLILVSVEIIMDAVHRLHEGHELRRLNELLVVSVLGFAVNLVGLTVFGHAHHGHGHSHGHSHGHDHGHAHTHEQRHEHTHANGHAPQHLHDEHSHDHEHKHDHHEHPHDHSHDHDHAHDHHDHTQCNDHARSDTLHPSPFPELPPTPFSIPSLPPFTPNPPSPSKPHSHSHSHSHSHDNENMQGIFLHILADALGSVAVIFSTLLTKYDGWSGWDPLASCAIALLIFFSAIPLVKSSGRKLMLGVEGEVEYAAREALQGLGELRGVSGYAGVRVWMDEDTSEGGGHHHHHGHSHDHGHARGEQGEKKMTGAIHVIAAKGADLEDVAERASLYLRGRGMDLLVHVEPEGSSCWCGGGKAG